MLTVLIGTGLISQMAQDLKRVALSWTGQSAVIGRSMLEYAWASVTGNSQGQSDSASRGQEIRSGLFVSLMEVCDSKAP